MAFVNEVNEETGGGRTVDHTLGAELVWGGWTFSSEVVSFRLKWRSSNIDFTTITRIRKDDDSGEKGLVTYQIHTCEYPVELRRYRTKIREMIKDSLEVFGVHYGKGHGVTVQVIFPASIGNLNPNYNWDTQKIEMDPVEYK